MEYTCDKLYTDYYLIIHQIYFFFEAIVQKYGKLCILEDRKAFLRRMATMKFQNL